MPHKEDIEYIDYSTGKARKRVVKGAVTFDTKVHMTTGTKHALRDIDRLMKEDERYKRTGKLTKKRARKK